MIKLWPHQIELINRVRSEMRVHKHVLMQSCTGSGKSIMAAAMILKSQQRSRRSHFIVPRRELIRQMSKNFNDFNIPHSFIAEGYSMNPHALTHIGSLSSMKKRIDKVPVPDVAFIDETHYGGATFDWLYNYYSERGCWVIGLSATPKPGKYYDAMVCGHSIRWHIENGFLSKYRLFAANFPDLSNIKVNYGEYMQKQLSDEMFKNDVIIGDAVLHYRSHAMGKLNLVFATDRRHNEKIFQRFQDAGIPSAILDSETSEKERVKIIQAYARREILNLCTVDICTFGFDLSANAGMDVTVESMSDLDPTMSLRKQLQKWGRVLRKKDYPALIFDHVGNSMKSPFLAKHGLPDWDREWDLREQDKRMRVSSVRAQAVRVCEFCFFAFDPNEGCCPGCGKMPTENIRNLKEKQGELQEVDSAAIKEQLSKNIQIRRARTLDDLFAILNQHGYKLGWAFRLARVKGITDDSTSYSDIRELWGGWRRRHPEGKGIHRVPLADAG